MKSRSPITTHVLDLTRGGAAEGVPVQLERRSGSDRWSSLAKGKTNADGRVEDLLEAGSTPKAGVYRLTFDTAKYFSRAKMKTLYPFVSIVFEVKEPKSHYHIPLLLNPFGYSTYRGT